MPTTNSMVPELMAAKKALIDKLKAPMTPSESEFIYKTIRQIERLQAINDLSKDEARVLRRNLTGSTAAVNAGASQELRKLLRRHATGPAPKRRSSHGVGPGPRMGPGRTVADRSILRASGSRSAALYASHGSAELNLPRIEQAESAGAVAQPTDEWSAITLYQDELWLKEEKSKSATLHRRKHLNKEQLDEHISLQQREYQRRQLMESKYADEQRHQLERWRDDEISKAETRKLKNEEERANLDKILALKNAREQMERERAEQLDANLLLKARKDLQDENDRVAAKKSAQKEYNRKVKEENAIQLAIKAKRLQEMQSLEQKAVMEAQAIMDKNEKDRDDRIQAQADRLTKMMAMGSKAVQSTQGRIDADNRRIALHAERKDRELAQASEAKNKMLAGLRQQMVQGLNYQLEAQEARRLKEIADAKSVAVQYEVEASRFRQEEELIEKKKKEKQDRYREALEAQKLATEKLRQQNSLAMNHRERGLNSQLLGQALNATRVS